MSWLLIGLGGFAGAISRYAVDTAVSARVDGAFPWGTFLVNVSGSFLLGLLYAVIAERALLPEEVRGPLLIGFIGAYTTFSTYMLETWRLVEAGSIGTALLYVLGSVGVGLVAVVVGLGIGRAI
jgi:fluoride exporter